MPKYAINWKETAYFYAEVEAEDMNKAKAEFDNLYPITDYTWIVDSDLIPDSLVMEEI